MWHDSFTYDMTPSCVTWLNHVYRWETTHSYVTWLSHACCDSLGCRMTHSYVTWLIRIFIWDMTHSCMTRLIDAWHDSSMCDMTHWCVKDSFMRIPHMHRYGVNQKLAHHLILLVCFILFSSKTCNCMPACNLSSFLSHTKFTQKICIRSSSFWFASIFHLFVCEFFGHRIWVQWIWASLKERCIALHLICALYAI